jgi:transposase
MSTSPGDLDLDRLPPEYRAAFEAQQARIATLSERNQRLEHLVREFRQALYGKKSEKLDADERQLAFEDLEVAVAEAEAAPPSTPSRARSAAGAKRNLGRLPEELPRREVVIEPESTLCPCGCGEMVKIGEDRSERLDIVPAQFRVIATVRPRYACPACQSGIVQAPAPPWLIEGGLPTEGAIAHVLVAKYADHTPLYRQCQIMRRAGLCLDRSTLAGWVGKAAFHLAPVVDRLAVHLKSSGKLFMDETRAPVLDPGRGKTKSGFLWALARDGEPLERHWSERQWRTAGAAPIRQGSSTSMPTAVAATMPSAFSTASAAPSRSMPIPATTG